MTNHKCKVRPQIVNVNRDEPAFYPFSIKTNKWSGSCNNINDPYTKMCIPDIVKNLNVKVFNVMSRTNETRHIEWHETCECKCRLDASVCNNKQRCNDDKCRFECKELIDKGVCDKVHECVCSYTICVILALIVLTVSIGIGAYFAYKYMNNWYLEKDVNCVWYPYSNNNLMNL